jgi:TRAP transporter TAXI family solute receptor
MVLDGRAAALWGGGVGWPGFTAVAQSPAGARFIAPSADEIKRIVAKHSFIRPITLPAGSYPGQDSAVATLGSWAFVLCAPSLPEDVAYRIARALHKAEAALGAKLAQAKESTLANTLAAAPRRELIHSGVLKYMREVGILR